MICWSAGVAGVDEAAHRDPLLGDREPDHNLRQVGAVILGVAEHPELVLALGRDLEVRRGGIEQDQVDLEVQQVRDGEEHLALDLLVAVQQEVHRPVEDLWILSQLAKPGQPHIAVGPLQRRQLAHRIKCAV